MTGRLAPSRRRQVIVGGLGLAIFLAVLLLTGLTPERWVDIDEPKSSSWLWRLSVSAADTSLVLLAVTLLLGPIRVLRSQRPLVHQPLRRTVGIWAGGFAIFHVSLAIFVHANLERIWSNWLQITPLEFTSGFRGLANWLGLVQLGIVVLLLWLSRDKALRRLGANRWKWLQRSAYLLFALVAAHALLYQRVEQRILGHSLPVRIILLVVVVLQLAGVVSLLRLRWRTAPA